MAPGGGRWDGHPWRDEQHLHADRADADKEIKVWADFTDDGGTAERRISEATLPVSAWALAGTGSGEPTLQHEGEKPMATDIRLRMGAVGFKGQVLDGTGASGLAMNVKSDAMWAVQTAVQK